MNNDKNIYLTDLKDLKNLPDFSELNSTKFKSTDETKGKYKIIQKMKIEKNEKKKIEENFLNYLIEEKINYANFEKIKNHYQEILINNYNKYNSNCVKIKKLKEKNEEYLSLFNKILVENFYISNQDIINYYNIEIEKIKKIIKIKEHELKCYNHLYSRTYKHNYLISNKLEEENKIKLIYNAQYEKYNILKYHALNNYTKQEKILNEIIFFQKIDNLKFNENIKKKQNIYDKLELDVLDLKKNISYNTKIIDEIKSNQIKLKKKIQAIKFLYNKEKKDFSNDLKNYLNFKLKLFIILNSLNVKNIENVIKKYNILQKKHIELGLLNSQINKEVINLNEILKNNENEINLINKKIKQKLNEKLKFSDEEFEEYSQKTKELKFENQIYKKKINESKEIIEKIYEFLILSIQKITFCLSKKIKYSNKYSNEFLIENSLNKKLYINFNNFIDYCNKNSIEFFFILIKDFFKYFSIIFIKTSKTIYNIFNQKLASVQKGKLFFNRKKNKKINFQIFNIDNQEIINIFYNLIKNHIKNQTQKKNIIKKNDEEILVNQNKNKTIINQSINNRSQFQKETLSRNEFLNKYLDYFRENSLNSQVKELKNSFLLIDKYTNELVSDEIKTKKKKRNNILKNITNKKPKRNESVMAKSFSLRKSENSIEISDYSDEEENKKNIDSLKNNKLNFFKNKNNLNSYLIKTNNLETNKIYFRINDLRNLELHYFKQKDRFMVNQSIFNDIYINFRKKLVKKKQYKSILKIPNINNSKNKILNKSISTKNLDIKTTKNKTSINSGNITSNLSTKEIYLVGNNKNNIIKSKSSNNIFIYKIQ